MEYSLGPDSNPGPCNEDSNVQHMGHLLKQVIYSKSDSSFEKTDEIGSRSGPKQAYEKPASNKMNDLKKL